MGAHTIRSHLERLRNGRSGLTLVGPRSTTLLATKLIESEHELVTSTYQRGVLKHQRTQPFDLTKEKGVVSLRVVSIEHVYCQRPGSLPIELLAP